MFFTKAIKYEKTKQQRTVGLLRFSKNTTLKLNHRLHTCVFHCRLRVTRAEGAGGDGKFLNHKGLCNNYLEWGGGGGGKLEGGIGENDNKRESGVGGKI